MARAKKSAAQSAAANKSDSGAKKVTRGAKRVTGTAKTDATSGVRATSKLNPNRSDTSAAKTFGASTSERAAVNGSGTAERVVKQGQLDGVRMWNIILAVLYALMGIAVFVLSTAKSLPLTLGYSGIDGLNTSVEQHPVYVTAAQHVFDIQPVYLLALLLFIPAVLHALAASSGRRWYEAGLQNGSSRLYRIGQLTSGSLIVLLLGLMAGITDVSLLLLVLGTAIVSGLCGAYLEGRPQLVAGRGWGLYWTGLVAGLLPWIAILLYLWGSHLYGGGAPVFVWWLFGSLALLYLIGVAHSLLRFKRLGKWQGPVFVERGYMILGFVAAAALAWQVYAGSLRP